MNPDWSVTRPQTCSSWSPTSSAIRNSRPSPRGSNPQALERTVGRRNPHRRHGGRLRLDPVSVRHAGPPRSGEGRDLDCEPQRPVQAFRIVVVVPGLLLNGGSRIVFSTRYQFSNPALEFVFAPVFDRVVSGMTRAFEVRANELASTRSPDRRSPQPPDGS